ncbi:NUDIX domain-containing protein [Zoogloeaceae bacterium G21618-S1]|nr:NUDIX domain-containing protein [Zoogloeaceae bacterium G21618-S1]
MVDAMPLVSIDLILVRHGREVLLGLRNNRPALGCWFVPGGRILKGEAIEAARARIIRRELGDVVPLDGWSLLGAYDHMYTDNFAGAPDVTTHYVVLGYRLEVIGDGPAVQADDQHESLQWVDIAQALRRSDVHDNTKAYLR